MSNKNNIFQQVKAIRQGINPKLRFPEFRAVQAWNKNKLENFVKEVTQRNKAGNTRALTLSSESGLVVQEEYFNKRVASKDTSNYKVVRKNDFVYNDRSTATSPYGTIKRLSKYESGIVSPIYLVFRPQREVVPEFLDFYFEAGCHEPEMSNIIDLGARYGRFNINASKFFSINIYMPILAAEQQKIADCLSSLDELITAQAQKLDTLKAHKKGLMQQLFPAEGETVPKLRFPEFQDAPEWSFRELDEFITERNEYPKEEVSLFSLTLEDGVTAKTERYERSFLVSNKENAYKIIMPNDFAYNPMNLRFGAIGRHSVDYKVALSKYYNIFYCDKTVDSKFCEAYFRSNNMIMFYDKMAIGSLIEKRRVHFSEFVKFKIPFPTLSEQQKLADCLSSLDELITAQTQMLDTLKAHKKGLMQQLFPSIYEVTG